MIDKILNRKKYLRSLSRPLTVGFTAIADFSSFIGQEYLAGIMQACHDYGLNFINLADAVNHSMFMDFQFLPQYLAKKQFLRAPLLDGLVTWASSLCTYMENQDVSDFFSSLLPLPMVDIGYLDIPRVSSIRISNESSLSLLIEHLTCVHGAKKIAFVYASSSRPHTERLECFKNEMQKSGLSVSKEDFFETPSLEQSDIMRTAESIFRQYWGTGANSKGTRGFAPPDAIVTSSDIIASHLVSFLESHGISVGEDVLVTGFNNQLLGLASPVPITTIDLAYFKRAYTAVELLLDQIISPELPKSNFTVPTKLVVRQSCGCFEEGVQNCFSPVNLKNPEFSVPKESKSELEITRYVIKIASKAFPNETDFSKESLAKAVVSDLCSELPPPRYKSIVNNSKILAWWRNFIKNRRTDSPTQTRLHTDSVTILRKGISPLIENEPEKHEFWEDICSSLLALEMENLRYANILRSGETVSINDIASLAVSFSSVKNENQLETILKNKLSSLKIHTVILSLSPYLSNAISQTEVKMIVPHPEDILSAKLPYYVREPALFPHSILQKHAKLQLELLCHNGMYLGFAFMSLENTDFTVYDSVRELLSQTLYNLYVTQGKNHAKGLLIKDRANLAHTAGLPYENEDDSPQDFYDSEKLTTQSLMDYLMDHLDEMTDLGKIAAFFDLNESYLSRRVKELTGSGLQQIHERLKIEQAKTLLKTNSLKVNEIALRLGFSNPNYFSNVFKKVTGLSPANWIKREK